MEQAILLQPTLGRQTKILTAILTSLSESTLQQAADVTSLKTFAKESLAMEQAATRKNLLIQAWFSQQRPRYYLKKGQDGHGKGVYHPFEQN